MIKILDYRIKIHNKQIGEVDIMIPKYNNLVINFIGHYESNGKRWFNIYSKKEDASDGQYKYKRIVHWELDSHTGQFLEKLAIAVKEYCEKNKIAESAPLNFENNEEFQDDCPF